MKKGMAGWAVATAVLASSWCVSAPAHHSFAAMFDTRNPGTIRGVVTKVTWGRPHPYIFLDVSNRGAQNGNWLVEGSNIRILESAGWSSTSVKPGDTISVCGYLGMPNVSTEGYPPGVVSERAMIGVRVFLADGRNLPLMNADRVDCP